MYLGVLTVERIREVKWSQDTFDRRLKLKATKKEHIKALITVYSASTKPYRSDIIEGKGKGLTLLLHGGPGTGKSQPRVSRSLPSVHCTGRLAVIMEQTQRA